MNTYVVYRHINKLTGEVFYIGIGKDEKRPYSKSGRNIFWKRVVQKYGYLVEIINRNLLLSEAQEIEKKLIAEYGRRNLRMGRLCNLTDGGEGVSNPNKKTRLRMREAKLGRRLSQSHKEKVRQHLIGRVVSEKTRQKIRESVLGGKHPMARKLIDTKTGIVYDTVKEAAESFGIKRTTLTSWISGTANTKTTLMYYSSSN